MAKEEKNAEGMPIIKKVTSMLDDTVGKIGEMVGGLLGGAEEEEEEKEEKKEK